MGVTLRRLRYFVAVAERLSFTGAAEAMHVSQPSLSAQVRALERGLGVELVRRTTRRIELTEAGRALHEDAVRVLADLEGAIARARRAGEASRPALRIAYTPSAGYEALPLILAELEVGGLAAAVRAERLPAPKVLEAVAAGQAEMGLLRGSEERDGIASEVIREEPLALFVAPGHRLATRGSIGLGELAEETLVVVPAALAPGFREVVLGLIGSREVEPDLVELAAPESRESLVDHLSRHPGHGFVGPVSMASADWGGVIQVPIDDPRARLGLTAVWSASDETRAAPLLAAARAVSDRQGWLPGA
jgi:DNA-binding transcriptional LysR family regulator